MGSLVDLSRIAKSDAYTAYTVPMQRPMQRPRFPGENVIMGAGAATAVGGAVIARRSNSLPARDAVRAENLQRIADSSEPYVGRNKRKKARFVQAQDRARVAALVSARSPARAKFVHRSGWKIAAAGTGIGAAGYGLKRLNNGRLNDGA